MQLTVGATAGRRRVRAAPARRRPEHRVATRWAVRLLLVGLPVALWAISTSVGRWPSGTFSSPGLIGEQLDRWLAGGFIWSHVWQTFQAVFAGFVIGALTGAGTALALSASRAAWSLLQPLIVVGNAVPRVVLAPIFTLWLGFGLPSKVALVTLMVFFPNFFNVYKGLKSVEGDLLRWAQSLGGSGGHLALHVYLPSTLVWILASLRTSVGFAFLAAIVGEYVGSTRGMGFLLARAGQVGSVTEIFSAIVVIMVMVLPLDLLVRQLDRRLERWRPGQARAG